MAKREITYWHCFQCGGDTQTENPYVLKQRCHKCHIYMLHSNKPFRKPPKA